MRFLTLISYIGLLIPISLLSQIQVSDIEYYLPRDDYARKGFIGLDDQEYFIEQGAAGTKVYLIKDDGLELLHNMTYRPTDSILNGRANNYGNSNSGLTYEDELLYELYWDYIYIVNILTGELEEVIDLKDHGIRLQSGFVLGDDYMFFTALGATPGSKIRYDRSSKIFEEVFQSGLRIGDCIYKGLDTDSLSCYNLSTNAEELINTDLSSISKISVQFINRLPHLLIQDVNGMHIFKDNQLVMSIDCEIPDSLVVMSIDYEKIVLREFENQILRIVSYDLASCESVELATIFDPINSEFSYFMHSDFAELGDDHLLFGFSNDWQGVGAYYLMDTKTGQYNRLAMLIGLLRVSLSDMIIVFTL